MESNLIFIDTGAFYAFLDKNDINHNNISKIFNNRDEKFITSNYIIDELITLLRVRKIPINKFKDFVNLLLSGDICNIIRITEKIDKDAWNMMNKYKDHLFSFTDCCSFIIMKNYDISKVCSLDKHFTIAGFDIIN